MAALLVEKRFIFLGLITMEPFNCEVKFVRFQGVTYSGCFKFSEESRKLLFLPSEGRFVFDISTMAICGTDCFFLCLVMLLCSVTHFLICWERQSLLKCNGSHAI